MKKQYIRQVRKDLHIPRSARRECRDAPVHAAAHGAGGMRARAADPLHPAELPVKNFFLLSATFPLPGLFTGQNGK